MLIRKEHLYCLEFDIDLSKIFIMVHIANKNKRGKYNNAATGEFLP